MMQLLQILGAITGLLGAMLVTSRSQNIRCLAFSIWIVSNLCLGVVFVDLQAWPLLAMQSFYMMTSTIGVINNFPRRQGEPAG